MNSRLILNVFLVIVLAGLGAVAFFKPGKQPQESITRLTKFDPNLVKSIDIRRSGQDPIRLTRRESGWVLAEAPEKPANGYRVQALLSLLVSPSAAQYSIDKKSLAPYGLDNPAIRIRFDDLELAIGDTDPVYFRRYVLNGKMLHLIEDRIYHHLGAQPWELLDLRLLPKGARIESIRLPSFKFDLQPGGHWQTEAEQPISADEINALVQRWQFIQALEVRPLDRALAREGEILIQLADAPIPIRLQILKTDDGLLLARNDWGIQYHLPIEQKSALTDPRQPLNPPPTNSLGR